jgi:hypothetical protein
MNIQVTGQTSKAYHGTICQTECARQGRGSYPFGVFASKELLVEATEQFMLHFLEVNLEWRRVAVSPGSNVICCAKWRQGEWNETSVEVDVTEILVMESVDRVQLEESQAVY